MNGKLSRSQLGRKFIVTASFLQRYGFWASAVVSFGLVNFRWRELLRSIKDRQIFEDIFFVPAGTLVGLGFLIFVMMQVAKQSSPDSSLPVFSPNRDVSVMLIVASAVFAVMSILLGWIGGIAVGLFAIR